MENVIIIIYIAVWVIMALIMGAFGGQRKIGFASVFVLSILFSPIIGGFAMLSSKRLEDIEFENKVLGELKDLKEDQARIVDIREKMKEFLGQ